MCRHAVVACIAIPEGPGIGYRRTRIGIDLGPEMPFLASHESQGAVTGHVFDGRDYRCLRFWRRFGNGADVEPGTFPRR